MVNAFYPLTIYDALKARRETAGKSLIICGGSDVMVVHKTAENVIFVNNIEEMKKVSLENGVLTIGAAVPYSVLLKNEQLPSILINAMSQIASPAIRNVGTVAGNICNASPAGDTLPVLYALNARVVVQSLDEADKIIEKEIAIKDFILGIRKIALADSEMVVAIRINEAEYKNYFTYYQKVGARRSEAISKASFAALVKTENEKISDIKIAFGSVGITVARFPEIERRITGLTKVELAEKKSLFVEEIMSKINPIDDQRSTAVYRKTVCRNLLNDFLESVE